MRLAASLSRSNTRLRRIASGFGEGIWERLPHSLLKRTRLPLRKESPQKHRNGYLEFLKECKRWTAQRLSTTSAHVSHRTISTALAENSRLYRRWEQSSNHAARC